MRTAHFYRDLPPLESFTQAIEITRHAPVPQDWWIIIADVIGSTQAIEAGAYKMVNTVGGACIAAVINVDRSIEIPFVFGGDGATFAIPDSLRERIIPALRAAQKMSRESFGLTLRAGLVSVAALEAQGHGVRMAKLQLSTYITQPSFSGRGWEEAERWVKNPQASGVLRVEESTGLCEGSFEGFECRWQNVPSFQDHKLALLVAATSADASANLETYRQVLAQIAHIYGEVSSYHPLRAERLRLSFKPRQLWHEWRVRAGQYSLWRRVHYFARMMLLNLAGTYLFTRNKQTGTRHWNRYPGELVENSDFRKFDGVLRTVMDGSEAQYQALLDYLESQYQAKKLVYGTHQSREALLTCIVFSYNQNHVHFVDGSDGGYAMAARDLKRRMNAATLV